ncbi:MAG: TIGR03943 family protein [Oscillatoria sp. PMC 1051.18]|nr:TIGR03943 family protein [Oscillatoria sp. PMC 1050.18]MEC5032717.1 TIGR03943 family protein [Oscillatoria sp. PMC 1051.18]
MNRNKLLLPVLDISVLIFWGILLLKFWLTSNLDLLMHPEYGWLAIAAGFLLLAIGILKGIQLNWRLRQQRWGYINEMPVVTHVSLLPPVLTSALLLLVAIIGLLTTPQVVSTSKLVDEGVSKSLALNANVSPSFLPATNPEDRTLIDWIASLNRNPEPDSYIGKKVKVTGLIVNETQLPEEYLLLSSLVINCCTPDLYPVALPVKLPENNRQSYTANTWLEIEGTVISDTLQGRRQLTIDAANIQEITRPDNPYNRSW